MRHRLNRPLRKRLGVLKNGHDPPSSQSQSFGVPKSFPTQKSTVKGLHELLAVQGLAALEGGQERNSSTFRSCTQNTGLDAISPSLSTIIEVNEEGEKERREEGTGHASLN
jgi:hypothetical protein